ncbi:cell division protein FtsQ/DivIB [Tamlana sp. 62-3]|uniref:Cell division protein FtsQ/DivIB n=1 Tax=Neotamlana sargassicola TaxID=2883125 RepID=A0A9X1L4H7_9FLAO|nr:cell division protein FtsQ/DivIB [Tamlana sargassicola]MCB4808085.1 cell division protein FtsQ/DivIB [Tamlana sargassicola]
MVLLLGLISFLFAFASGRNAKRNVGTPKINFLGENNLFITSDNVSKLLIQNYGSVSNIAKETLDLNVLENALKSNAMIKNAEVYLSVNGTLNADVEQKTPIARVNTTASYYIDADGQYMPLSSNFSARVPLVTGYVEKNNLKSVYKVAQKVINDDFLKTHVFEIHQDQNRKLYLKLRQCSFMVKLGDVSFIDKKVNNLKAFYKKSSKEKTLNQYSVVNLQFENQVICTKI